jgi:hypothetical protein
LAPELASGLAPELAGLPLASSPEAGALFGLNSIADGMNSIGFDKVWMILTSFGY